MTTRNHAIFGPAGACERSAEAGAKTTEKLLSYLAERGCDAFEYQCGRSLNVSQAKAEKIGEKAASLGIELSLHAPYYISLASAEQEKRDNSVGYILRSAETASWMGAKRIVVHPGGIGKYSREEAYEIARVTLTHTLEAVRNAGLDTIICPEVMGKINQLGNLDEVLGFCDIDAGMLPCVDFGHLNSRLHGQMDIAATLERITEVLGEERARLMHVHFSKIKYSAGGEVCHLTFEDGEYGPEPEPLMRHFAERGMTPTVICESAGTQTDDSLELKRLYQLYERK